MGVIDRALTGVRWPNDHLAASHQDGCTEGYIAQLASSLLVASGGHDCLETGGFLGTTSAWLAHTLERMGGGTLTIAEIDYKRACAIQERLDLYKPWVNVDWRVINDDVLTLINSLPPASLDFVWIDDDHQHAHVDEEIRRLIPKVRLGGLLVLHDVFGSCNLQVVVRKWGGYSLNLPRLGPAGGLGIIQV